MAEKITARDHLAIHLLPHWGRWVQRAKSGIEPSALGFVCGHAVLNRAAARYRVARSLKGVVLETFSASTADGYAGLFRLFLAWAAFEQYCKALGLSAETRDRWFASHIPPDADAHIRALDPNGCFFHLILNKVHGDTEANVAAYVKRQHYSVTYLAAAVRHVFAHGILTPNANKADPANVAGLTSYLAGILLDAMAADFSARVVSADPGNAAA
jgi:hypothetical protein